MIELDDLISIDAIDYVVLDIIFYDGINYYFVNRVLENESNTTDFYFFKVENGIMVKENNNEMLEILCRIASNNMQKKFEKLKEGE